MSQTPQLGAAKGNEINRILELQRKREDEVKKLEETKKKIQEQNRVDVTGFNTKFGTSKGDVIQDELGKVTVGLVTLEQLKKHKEELAKKEQILEHLQRKEEIENEKLKREADRKNRKSKLTKSTLSFGDEAEELEEEDVEPVAKKKVVKNPTVDTSFLPDKDRELREIEERRKLTQEWHEEQERKKAEVIEVTYSYWDGSGHRRALKCTKGMTVGQFLEMARKNLQDEFRELRGTSCDNLIYVKEDLIIPHDMTFHVLIETKARGKSGPLFHFDVHEDVRTVNDARIEKDESHAGKVVERHWYERNKHIFPASRWEPFDPEKKWEKYTIHGD
uniref:FAM50A/XAP5 C-terminal domain-containing protein n=1 Tax=Guillardia theta TaxID=55529 RepID=A0A7S4P3F7_GUITH|mmetsp:Transcript_42575/g.134055  ORF Transcript_42575/g.134055 Transcript_42575/m.134055 type:complete len:333 (+) Transcript_42575:3-1001(+)